MGDKEVDIEEKSCDDEFHGGCQERYKCCLMPEDARGCEDKWECCDQAPEEKGCQTVCNRCGVRWGHKPGCSWPELDEESKDDQDITTNDYDEAHNPVIVHEDDNKIKIMDTMDAIEEDQNMSMTTKDDEKKNERRQMSESVHMSTDELL